MSNLLATKLHRPSIPPQRVPRPHLIEQLNAGLALGRPMTLVSAPAGFGKTTCVSTWVHELDHPVTWLSLDASDDEPGRFFTYLLAALQKIDPSLGQEIQGVLRSGQLSPAEVISTTLINDILALQGRFLLVLDDFQVIQERFILQVLRDLVTHLFQAPVSQPLHLALLTREEPSLPLARLRASNQMTEIRARDLRFTRRQAERFLNEAMGLALSPDDVTALEDKTEGWIVGLQLAALAMQAPVTGPAPSQFIANLSGSHRHILSYLTEQVLSRQPGEIQDFLLQTSILNRLNGALCDAVTRRTDSHALLAQLFRANLFLVPLDDEGRWYRYHQLFADLIKDQATHDKDDASERHRRASRWYAQASDQAEPGSDEHSTFVNAAIQHALSAADYELAVALLERHAMDMIMQWHAKLVSRWMQALPAEWAAQSPKANLAFAWMHLLGGDVVQATPYLARLQEIFADSQMAEKDPTLKAQWLALQSTLLNAQGKPAESLNLAQQALAIVPQQESHVRSLIYLGLAGAYQQLDDYDQAVEAYQMIIQHGRAAGNLTAEMLGISGLALMALQHGQLHFAFDLASQGVERITHSGVLPPISAAVYGELGQICYHWHQLDQARTYFARAAQVSALSGYSDAEIYYGVIRSRLHHIEGKLEAAAQEMQQVVELVQADAPVAVREEVIAQQVRICLAQDRLTAAETALKKGGCFPGQDLLPDLKPDPPITHPLGLLYNSALRILLYRAQVRHEVTRLKRGIALADRLIAGALQRQYLPVALEALLLRAQMHALLGNDPARLADYARALTLAEPEGFISVFVEGGPPVADALRSLIEQDKLGNVRLGYVTDILTTFSESQPPTDAHQIEQEGPALTDTGADLLEPLTDRELDVLRLMAQGLKYKEIAARLFISLNTVRSHVKAIYDKLDVHNRTQAVQKARQLGIL